jgi:hypothetical protein
MEHTVDQATVYQLKKYQETIMELDQETLDQLVAQATKLQATQDQALITKDQLVAQTIQDPATQDPATLDQPVAQTIQDPAMPLQTTKNQSTPSEVATVEQNQDQSCNTAMTIKVFQAAMGVDTLMDHLDQEALVTLTEMVPMVIQTMPMLQMVTAVLTTVQHTAHLAQVEMLVAIMQIQQILKLMEAAHYKLLLIMEDQTTVGTH